LMCALSTRGTKVAAALQAAHQSGCSLRVVPSACSYQQL
jgi:hypothetical protein